ncbi:sugar phosphate isomerase/epimerase family protein [Stratiformator vulcanicus]|uniref:Xylose isomerase-like TIM barrel n=1 Tax=Stratiformator vulcanicus TaxID=2527980 RepID=A0A517QWX3_9PLAN|nr:sugar phosphate isomerase/epimerase family protein [Stratiformator vulcanicus]QDT36068.1 Xylose isomerase-like TIM barrel [Stratiformator vulcanicus]
MNRRHFFKTGAAASLLAGYPRIATIANAKEESRVTTSMGLVIYTRKRLREATRDRASGYDLYHPATFLEHCHTLGVGGIQAELSRLDESAAEKLRQQAQDYSMYIEGITRPPKDAGDIGRFRKDISIARRAGALAVRTTIIPGRRYEQFQTLDQFKAAEKRGESMLKLAAPVVEQLQVPLAVENHKDQRVDERVGLMKRIDSKFIGVCLDTGNNLALVDDPLAAVEAFAPWAHSVHLKDQGVKPYEEGFLLADVPLGEGCLPLESIVSHVRRVKPDVRFSLEMITRDPLKVPCLTPEYWATMPHVPGADVAKVLSMVRERSSEIFSPVDALSLADRAELENRHIEISKHYAAETLKLTR